MIYIFLLDGWILEHAGDPLYRFGRKGSDSRSLTEDLGDDAILASRYGIANLKHLIPKLEAWTSEKGQTYKGLEDMYGQVLKQFGIYMRHVVANIGGMHKHNKTTDQPGAVYAYVDKEHQRNCLQFIQSELFETPHWLLDASVFSKFKDPGTIERIHKLQLKIIARCFKTFPYGPNDRKRDKKRRKGLPAYRHGQRFEERDMERDLYWKAHGCIPS